MFVDKVQVFVKAGNGGNGAVSFRHEKFIDKGGPDGGDGGDGGDIIIVGSNRTNTLANFRYQKEIKAKDGGPGSKRKRHGKSAPDLRVMVPVGTVVSDDNDQQIADITSENQEVVIAFGGKGGFGNAHFTSSRRQTPRVAEKGAPGDEFMVTMELKMIAEVGLVGLPNAGKSTLLSRISAAKPEIANYPFTTIRPNLGMAQVSDERSVLIADIPGLIEGASEGKGLGDEFLRHVERTKVLVHLIDAYNDDVSDAYKIIRKELADYKTDLSAKPEVIVITKTENLDQEIIDDIVNRLKKQAGKSAKIMAISSRSGQGLKELLYEVASQADKQKIAESLKEEPEETIPTITLPKTDKEWTVEVGDGYFVVKGSKIERFAVQTNYEGYAGVERLRDIMRKMGIIHELERRGIEPGQLVYFGNAKKQHIEY